MTTLPEPVSLSTMQELGIKFRLAAWHKQPYPLSHLTSHLNNSPFYILKSPMQGLGIQLNSDVYDHQVKEGSKCNVQDALKKIHLLFCSISQFPSNLQLTVIGLCFDLVNSLSTLFPKQNKAFQVYSFRREVGLVQWHILLIMAC